MLLVDDRLKAAKDHALAGRNDNAALLYESILDVSPGHPEALSGLIETRLANGDLEGAQTLLSKSTAVTGQDPGFLTLAAKISIISQKPDDAEKLVERALALDPYHAQAALLRAEFLASAGALSEAEDLLNTVRSRNTGDTDILLGISRLYYAYGLFSPALMIAQEALSNAPNDSNLSAFVGQILTALGDHGKATSFFEAAHLKEPTNPEFMLALANNAAAIGQSSEALRIAGRAKALFPDLMPAWLSYIKIKAERGEALEALREFAPVAKGAKDRMDATLTLGTAYRLAGEPEKAIQLLEPLMANAAGMKDAVRGRLFSILRDAFLSTGQIEKIPSTLEQPVVATLDGGQSGDANPEVLRQRVSEAVMVIDPGLSNLEFMVLARFLDQAGRDKTAPLAGPSTLSQLSGFFGYNNFLPNDAPNGNAEPPTHSGTLPISQILGLPTDLRGGVTGPCPYLPVKPELLKRWQDALSEFPKPWIGIAWNEAQPGLTLDTLLPALRSLPGTLVSAVWDHSRRQLSGHQGIIDAGAHIKRLDDLAALLHALDFVVGPDGIILHGAGAAGTPGLVIAQYMSPWYWYAETNQSLWYPSMDVLKAPRFGHWATLIPELTDDIHARIDNRLASSGGQTEETS
jgi:tetratricopeptide (TPR) repeat protein